VALGPLDPEADLEPARVPDDDPVSPAELAEPVEDGRAALGVDVAGDHRRSLLARTGAAHIPPGDRVVLRDLLRRALPLPAAHARHPFLVTFDDHEVENNHTGRHPAEGGDPRA
jgi:hypothetical protein